ncbi:MAG: rRNA pseudouridine synthase [Lachnospiraceae bacterium]|nr:rRNA pseudouridine synthase [Lachnospiraceae bacterium]
MEDVLMRLDKYLSNMGVGTRTEVKGMIRKGRVQVNGGVVKTPDIKIKPEEDAVSVDGETITYEKYRYFMFHKPAGCITATEDPMQKTVMDYFEVNKKDTLFPVGRLDKDTEGLLLVTDDGALAHALLSPKKKIGKTYFAIIDGEVTEEDVVAFSKGLDLGNFTSMPAKLEIRKAGMVSEIIVTIYEGKFHQVKRMFEAVGKKVTYLKRLSMGALCLDENLSKGEYRPLTEEEIQMCKANLDGSK